MGALYNDFEPYTTKLLKLRVDDGCLPPGEVLSEDVRELCKTDLSDYGQVHLYAGIGGFPLACRMAGLPDDFRLQTGGFPCQPFSAAGRRRGVEDNRYLWPETLACLKSHRPDVAIYENVAGLASMAFPGKETLVGIQADLGGAINYDYETQEQSVLGNICRDIEEAGYTVQVFILPACGVAAPHQRNRLVVVAYARHLDRGNERASKKGHQNERKRPACANAVSGPGSQSGVLGNTEHDGLPPPAQSRILGASSGGAAQGANTTRQSARTGQSGDGEAVADAKCQQNDEKRRSGECGRDTLGRQKQTTFRKNRKTSPDGTSGCGRSPDVANANGSNDTGTSRQTPPPCKAKWIQKRDNSRQSSQCRHVSDRHSAGFQGVEIKGRDCQDIAQSRNQFTGRLCDTSFGFTERCVWPVEPGVGRVVNGLPGRVDRIKGLGNAVVPALFAEIISLIMVSLDIEPVWHPGFAPESTAA